MDSAKKYRSLTDNDLLINAQGGDQKAFAELMRRYKKSLFHTILKMVRNMDDADDLTIETFSKAFRNLDKYQHTYAFSTWLFRVGTNHTIDFLRKKRMNTISLNQERKDHDGESMTIDVADTGRLTPQEEMIKTQKSELLEVFISKLPARYHVLVKMRYFQELSIEEISKELDLPQNTVKVQLFRARDLLHNLMKSAIEKM